MIEVVKDFADVIRLSDGSKVSASQFLNLFQFPPEMQYTYVSKLSGGEKRRLHLLTVLVRNPYFLILEEPTNDLDLLTLNILEDFLMHYEGCLLVVSHDRYFMDKLVDHLFVFEGDGMIKDYNGSYSEYRIQKEEEESKKARAAEPKVVASKMDDQPKKKKVSYKEKLEYETLEKEIASLEKEKGELENSMGSGETDHTKLRQWSERMQVVIREIDEKLVS